MKKTKKEELVIGEIQLISISLSLFLFFLAHYLFDFFSFTLYVLAYLSLIIYISIFNRKHKKLIK